MNLWRLANASVQSTIALQLHHRKGHPQSLLLATIASDTQIVAYNDR